VRALEFAHGVAAWIATALLLFAAASRFAPRALAPLHRRASVVGLLATVVITVAAALGLALDGAYQNELRQRLFIEAPRLGWLFERKHHVAVVAVLLAWCAGAAVALRARRSDDGEAFDANLERIARRGYVAAFAFAAFAAIASVIVARVVRFR
jgi:hypothetical protein